MISFSAFYQVSFKFSYDTNLSLKYSIDAQKEEFLIVYHRPGFNWEIPLVKSLHRFDFLSIFANLAKISLSFYLLQTTRKKLKKLEKSNFAKKQKWL